VSLALYTKISDFKYGLLEGACAARPETDYMPVQIGDSSGPRCLIVCSCVFVVTPNKHGAVAHICVDATLVQMVFGRASGWAWNYDMAVHTSGDTFGIVKNKG
jgi:hypothetical protein